MTLSRETLVLVRRLAIRKRVWFKFLDKCERAIVSLTIRCVDEVRSAKLASIVTAIVAKLTEALKSGVERLTETFGRPLAYRLSLTAVGWGNLQAWSWRFDRGFMRFLAVCYMNTPGLFRA